MKEIWRDIAGCFSYQVSNLGRVRTIGRVVRNTLSSFRDVQPKILSPTSNGKGYLIVGIQINNYRKNYYVHRLVGTAFIDNPDNLPEVNHKDGVKSNNRWDNLEWTTAQGNRDHAVEHNLVSYGEKKFNAKLTEADVVEIFDLVHANPLINKSELGRKYGVDCTCIIKIKRMDRWRRVLKAHVEAKEKEIEANPDAAKEKGWSLNRL